MTRTKTKLVPSLLRWLVLVTVGVQWSSTTLAQRDAFVTIREQMVTDHLAGEGIKNEAGLKSMRQVPRHLFVPPAPPAARRVQCPAGKSCGRG